MTLIPPSKTPTNSIHETQSLNHSIRHRCPRCAGHRSRRLGPRPNPPSDQPSRRCRIRVSLHGQRRVLPDRDEVISTKKHERSASSNEEFFTAKTPRTPRKKTFTDLTPILLTLRTFLVFHLFSPWRLGGKWCSRISSSSTAIAG